MTTLSELTVQVLTARLAKRDMSLEELQKEMVAISNQLKAIDAGTELEPVAESPAQVTKPQLTIKQAFKKDEVICMICNKGFKTLKRHLTMAHNLKPGEYRKQFGIPSTQSLAAKSYSDSRRQMALDKGLGEGLAKFRADKAAKKVDAPVVKLKTPVPTAKKKAANPVVKTAVTAKMEKKATLAIAALKKMSNQK